MIHGEVIGEIWATIKVAGLSGMKMLVVRPAAGGARLGKGVSFPFSDIVAVDLVSAGVGDRVIVALGKAARLAAALGEHIPIEAAIVGIVDDVHLAPHVLATEGPDLTDDAAPDDAKEEAKPERGEKAKARANRRQPRARAARADDETPDLFAGASELPEIDASAAVEPSDATVEPETGAAPPAPRRRRKKGVAPDPEPAKSAAEDAVPPEDGVRVEYEESPTVPSFEDVESVWDDAAEDDTDDGEDENQE